MPDSCPHVLVVEDEQEIRELMALHLLRRGYQVKECVTAEEAMKEIEKSPYHLIVLDWMLPGASGIDVLSYIRSQPDSASVLMVTAKTEPEDIVRGLEKGADDYMTKPFDPAVFLARVKALLRRTQLVQSKETKSNVVILGDLTIDMETYEVSLKHEKLHLTPSEFKLLATMILHRGKVLTRDQLIENIQGEGINVIGRTIDTHVFGLRKKLGEWADNIETIRGIGYRVRVD